MARFGISPENTLGISMPPLRDMARDIGKNHTLAEQVWSSGIHEARILACLIDDPKLVTEEQMERWVMDFDSWDVCDQCCGRLFDKTEWAYQEDRFKKCPVDRFRRFEVVDGCEGVGTIEMRLSLRLRLRFLPRSRKRDRSG